MPKFPWKTALAGAAVLAGTVYVVAAQLAPGPGAPAGAMQGQMTHDMRGGMGSHGAMTAQPSGMPTMPGQDAFGTVQEIVKILEADPATDWSKVNIDALREHLIDMNEVTLRAQAAPRLLDDGIAIDVTGEGRTLAAIKRMLPAHARQLASTGWNATTQDRPDGVMLTVKTPDPRERVRLKALGLIGIMTQGAHHQPHHLMLAKGEFAH